MIKQLSNNRGSLTVESVFIVMYIIGVVFLLVHMAHGIYQKTVMQSVANEAVEMAQRYWLNPSKDFTTGNITSTENILYARLYRYPFDLRNNDKKEKLENYIKLRLSGSKDYKVFNYDGQAGIDVDCKVINLIVHKKVVVTIKDTKESPFKFFRKLFGLSENREIKVEAEGVLHDPAEYIRTIDLGKDLILETRTGRDAVGKMDEWREKLKEYLGELGGDE